MLRIFDGYLTMEGGLMQSPRRSVGLHRLLLSICLIYLPSVMSSQFNHTCAPGVDTPGVTYPKGDIVLEAGQSLEILCILNPNHRDAIGRNASNLVFYRNDELVHPEFLHVVNATTLRLYVKEMPASSSMYYCRLHLRNSSDLKSVCLNSVSVGYKPQEVQNFTCISYNWQSLTCSWVPPHNYVKTTYTLVYRLPGRAGRRIQHGCPQKLDTRENKCFWNSSTVPHYRQPYEYYFFTINGRNVLGNMTAMTIKFHHYAHIIPSEPKELRVLNRTLNSILLKWDVPFPLPVFPPGLIQKVEYQHQWLPRNIWQVADTNHLKMQNGSYVYNFTNIEYAYTLYDIRVYMKSAVAIGDDWWSKPASITHVTMSTIPGAAPKTDVGSFEVAGGLPYRDVYIYWQEIPEYLHNGQNFEYKITAIRENGHLKYMSPNEMTRTYAKFKGLTFNNYTFTIVSSNSEGQSIESSQVYIPSQLDSPGDPASFTKIAFGNGIYELSWKHPKDQENIVNYTIFWCSNDRDRPYQCAGYLNWTYVSSDTQIINITVPEDKIYQFAISANTKFASSGMVWASCTVIHNKAVGKMKNIWTGRIGSTFIELGWKLECSDRIGLVEGYRIHYCPISSPYDLSCKEPGQNRTIASSDSQDHTSGRATDLRPYTTYMVAVSVLTKSGEGIQSDPLYVTTLEEAPDSPPTNVTVFNVSNSSMEVFWVPPLSLNGVLRYFEVHYNNKSKKVERDSSVILQNLLSFTLYEVRIAACTVSCSNLSDPVLTRTSVGVPGIIERPSLSFINTSLVEVSWQPPVYPAGITSYYELRVNQSEGEALPKYQSIHSTKAKVSVPDCEVEGAIVSTFSVRAVNVAPGNAVYRGPWSTQIEINCYNAGPSKELQIWIPLAVVISVLLGFFVYGGRRAYVHYVEMSKFEVQIPEGLKESVKGDKTMPPDDDDRTLKKLGISGPADEEKLLNGPEGHGRNPSGGSSGRGSAHESVSSEQTSGTQISSDSGADVDRYPPSPDMFRVVSENAPSSLRFRSQSLQSDLTDSDHRIRSTRDYIGDGSSSPSQTWDYLRIGLTESNDLPPPGGYVTLESVTNPGGAVNGLESSCLDDVSPISSSNYVAHPYAWMPKEAASLLIPVCTNESAESPEESNDFLEAPDSYCRVGWQPEAGNLPPSSEAGLYPGRPSISVAEPIRPTASEGYVTVASLGAGGLPAITESARCHSISESPAPDCGDEDGEGIECSTDTESQPSRMASPGYVALGYFTKDEGIHNANRDVMESLGSASSGETTYHALANDES